MKLKKLVGLGLIAVAAVALGACSNGAGNKSASSKAVTLTYANWNLGNASDKNLERLMIKEFNSTHKDIQVKIDTKVQGDDYPGKLNTAASAGKLPDVFMINDLPTSFKNKWLKNLDTTVNSDSDFKKIDSAVVDTTKIDGHVYSVPFAKHMLGYYANNDLLDKLNLDVPTEKTTPDEFFTTAKAASDVGKGHVGMVDTYSLIDWYPGEQNKSYGFFTYADGKFHLDSPEMTKAISTTRDLISHDASFTDLPKTQTAKLSGGDGAKAFKAGQVAFYYSGTYSNADFQKTAKSNISFVGLPGGRQAVVTDLLGIAKSSKHPKEAFEFAKYMTFGKTGFLERMKLAEKNSLEMATLPITTDSTVAKKYWQLVTVPGVKEANDRLENAMSDPMKYVPGYIDARFTGSTGIKIGDKGNAQVQDLLLAAQQGKINYSDYAAQLQKLSQKFHDDAVKSLSLTK
jgi:multiple sugar transport system substrate-binding protein